MGDAISSESYTPRQRTTYRRRLEDELERFDRHLQGAEFVDHGTIGLELELNLVDGAMRPHPNNQAVLALLEDEYQSEIGAYNVEMNHPPLSIAGDGLARLADGVAERLAIVRNAAEEAGSHLAMVGTLPTMSSQFLDSDEWMTRENRYAGLNNSILESRGELVKIDFRRDEKYTHYFETIAPESTCTSMQLHLQVAPNRFASAWNASQAIAGVQVALSANSPLFMGHKLWHESRIPVFKQSIDTRTKELVNQGVRPRVWFGERWITSVFDLFEENVRYFSPLLPEGRAEAGAPFMNGDNPGLHYLNLHNGTIWRWNRPIYDPNGEVSHLRVENRLLPAGPTVTDIVADAAFYYGLVKALSNQTRPVWSRLSFDAAERNFLAGAKHGIQAEMEWPTLGSVGVAELVEKHLLELASEGLRSLEVDQAYADEYLGVIEGRVRTRQNGAAWQLAALERVASESKPLTKERTEGLARVVRQYLKNSQADAPVHTWTLEVE